MDCAKGSRGKQSQAKKKNQPPPLGYPTGDEPHKKSCCPITRKRDDKSFIEGCLAALCCCWLCDVCCG